MLVPIFDEVIKKTKENDNYGDCGNVKLET